MPKIKIEAVVDHLDNYFQDALIETMRKFARGVRYDKDELYYFFLQRIYENCSVWEEIPEKLIELPEPR